MNQRKLGTQGLTVSAVGLGCMRMLVTLGSWKTSVILITRIFPFPLIIACQLTA